MEVAAALSEDRAAAEVSGRPRQLHGHGFTRINMDSFMLKIRENRCKSVAGFLPRANSSFFGSARGPVTLAVFKTVDRYL